MAPRTLRSKGLRALLWYAADGKCQRCGEPLGEDWEADHIVPWKVTRRTNVHEMQALCRECNRRKGATMLREHQRKAEDICKRIVGGERIRRVYINVTPGGGKSLIPMIVARYLVPHMADAICWVVPRISLQDQGQDNFLDKDDRALVGGASRTIRASTNDEDPCRGHDGYTITYQALQADLERSRARGQVMTNVREFNRKRYILILDEHHHAAEGSTYAEALAPLVQRAAMVWFMSGTLERGDGLPIAFMPYVKVPGGFKLDLPEDVTGDCAFIGYTRTQALREHAVKPLHFQRMDGRAEWTDREGRKRVVESLAEAGDDESAEAVYTALSTEYAQQLLARSLSDWTNYRRHHPTSKLLVVAPSIARAREYVTCVQGLSRARVEIATSDAVKEAKNSINRFKRAFSDAFALDVLVTVAMAYEGLDVPEITHLTCLTHIRSRPWIEQMLARAVRVQKGIEYEHQWGFVYGPDDALLTAIIQRIIDEQDPFVKDRKIKPPRPPKVPGADPEPEVERDPSVIPLDSSMTRERSIDLTDGETIDYEESEYIQNTLRGFGLDGVIDPITWKRIDSAMRGPRPAPTPAGDEPPLRPSQREWRVRQTIDQEVKRLETVHHIPYGTINKRAIRKFGKARDAMNEQELEKLWVWLNQESWGTGQSSQL